MRIKTGTPNERLASFAIDENLLSPAATGALLSAALNDPDSFTRRFAAYQLGQLEALTPATARTLISAFDDDDADVRMLAAQAAIKHARTVLHLLLDLIQKADIPENWPLSENPKDSHAISDDNVSPTDDASEPSSNTDPDRRGDELLNPFPTQTSPLPSPVLLASIVLLQSPNVEIPFSRFKNLVKRGAKHQAYRHLTVELADQLERVDLHAMREFLDLREVWHRNLIYRFVVGGRFDRTPDAINSLIPAIRKDLFAVIHEPTFDDPEKADLDGEELAKPESSEVSEKRTARNFAAEASVALGREGSALVTDALNSGVAGLRSAVLSGLTRQYAKSHTAQSPSDESMRLTIARFADVIAPDDFYLLEDLTTSESGKELYLEIIASQLTSESVDRVDRALTSIDQFLEKGLTPATTKKVTEFLLSLLRTNAPKASKLTAFSILMKLGATQRTYEAAYAIIHKHLLTEKEITTQDLFVLTSGDNLSTRLMRDVIALSSRSSELTYEELYDLLFDAARTAEEKKMLLKRLLSEKNLDYFTKWNMTKKLLRKGVSTSRDLRPALFGERATADSKAIALGAMMLLTAGQTQWPTGDARRDRERAQSAQTALLRKLGVNQTVFETVVRSSFTDGDFDGKLAVLDALAHAPFDISFIIREALRDPEPMIRALALDLLGQGTTKTIDTIKTIKALLADSDPDVRSAAVKALSDLKNGPRILREYLQSTRLIREAGRNSDVSDYPQWAVLSQLGRHHDWVIRLLFSEIDEDHPAPYKAEILSTILSIDPKNPRALNALSALIIHTGAKSSFNRDSFILYSINDNIENLSGNFPWVNSKVLAYSTILIREREAFSKIHKSSIQTLSSWARRFAVVRNSRSGSLPPFPWPAPEYSDKEIIPKSFFEGPDATLATVKDIIVKALEGSANNFSYGLFGNIPSGYALMARIERIKKDGSPFAGPHRWTTGPPPLENLSALLIRLFTQPPGYFRVIVFVITAEDDIPFDSDASLPSIKTGWKKLPDVLAAVPLGDRNIFALVYTFKRHRGGRLTIGYDGSPSARSHLIAAGIWNGLADQQ